MIVVVNSNFLPPLSPIPPISTIFWKKGLQNFNWRGELDKIGVLSYWGEGSGCLEMGIVNFTSGLLFDLTFKVNTERCCITWYFPLKCLAYFVLVKAFLIVFYFFNSLNLRGEVYKR